MTTIFRDRKMVLHSLIHRLGFIVESGMIRFIILFRHVVRSAGEITEVLPKALTKLLTNCRWEIYMRISPGRKVKFNYPKYRINGGSFACYITN
jgi:hypothetical protein